MAPAGRKLRVQDDPRLDRVLALVDLVEVHREDPPDEIMAGIKELSGKIDALSDGAEPDELPPEVIAAE
jgi:hypothetical protein